MSQLLYSLYPLHTRRWDTAVGIATGYWLDDSVVAVRVSDGQELPLIHSIQTSPGANIASYTIGTGG
jgi:hypothetical protein